ncbi:hypothetical protein [Terrabacter ginsenosidimutans]|uniref:hypothetical protein n=1 Tax=Terrabacter ginsenosidimutans TaxID=490575 RepID=UPI0031E554A4
MPEPTCSPGLPESPPVAASQCWTWPAAQHRRMSAVVGVGRSRQRRLRAGLCRTRAGGRGQGTPPPA